jgi:O-antigen/teichoic acid export membrane protein
MTAITRQRNLTNIFYSGLAYIGPMIAMLIAYRVLDKYFGRDGAGVYLFATSFAVSFSFLGFGMASAVTKFVAASQSIGRRSEVYTSGLVVYSSIGLVAAAAVCINAASLASLLRANGDLRRIASDAVFFGGLIIPLAMANEIGVAMFKGLQNFKYVAANRLLLSLFTFVVTPLAVVIFQVQIVGLVLISLLGYFVMVFVSAAQVRSLGYRFDVGVVNNLVGYRRTIKEMLGFGGILTAVSLLAFAYFQGQRFAVAFLLGPAAMASYIFAISAVSRVHGIISSATEVLFPSAVALRSGGGQKDLSRFYLNAQLFSFLSALLFCGTLWLFSDVLVAKWLGAPSADVADLIKLFAAAYVALALSPVPYHLLNAYDKPVFNLINISLRVAINCLALALAFFALDAIDLHVFALTFTISAILVDGILWPLIVRRLLSVAARHPSQV